MICNLLAKAQQGDTTALMELINRFQPLLKKYARKLRYNDAYEDCRLFFIELVKSMDLKNLNNQEDRVAIAYINISITNFYNKRIRKYLEAEREILVSELTEKQKYYMEVQTAKQDEIDVFTQLGIENLLNENERKVIYLVYVRGYTTAEIDRICHKSRQSVNQLKCRALCKLRRMIYAENA